MSTDVQQKVALRLEKLTVRIGAIVHGIRLSGNLDTDTVMALRDALHRHKVLFFRDQHGLTDQEQEDFAGLIGEAQAHPLVDAPAGTRYVFELDSSDGLRVNGWHTDITFQPAIAYASVLRAIQLPSVGGDTLWANTAAAYQAMPEPLRNFLDHAWARHSTDPAGMPERIDGYSGKGASREAIVHPEAHHPLVHVIPETGERAILMGFFFRQVLGMSEADSLRIYQMVQAHITRPENVVRWRWAAGDVAMWDNRSTQHYGVADYTERRILHRVSLRGKEPVPLHALTSAGQ